MQNQTYLIADTECIQLHIAYSSNHLDHYCEGVVYLLIKPTLRVKCIQVSSGAISLPHPY